MRSRELCIIYCHYFELGFQFSILITGYAKFTNAIIQVYENESSIEVCIKGQGYGFVVNVSTVEVTATGMFIST
jgi:hypothetical protein